MESKNEKSCQQFLPAINDGVSLQSQMKKSFGEHLLHINNIVKLEVKHEKLIKRYKIFTLTGWMVGILAVVAAAIL